ncbi:MAG: hypothetical protein CM1200mP1_10460 [Candidatus Neomarinimicrobiota bacterium]|nr:MAG: hypothetical protein CM1200mP1_10460 [Candidatus Neomarinimicrobiota bacterium]
MSIPLFNLIVVNERALMGPSFNYETDRYFENIIKRGAIRCYVFQFTVFVSGIIIVMHGPGLSAIVTNWVLAAKTIILFTLMILLSYVHFTLQPKIEEHLSSLDSNEVVLKILHRLLLHFELSEKKLATVCLFLVISAIILGVQTYVRYDPIVTIGLIYLPVSFHTVQINL